MRWTTWERVVAILLVLPSVIAIAIFVYGFIGFTSFASLTKWNNLLPDFTLVGFSNYQSLFANQRFQIDLRNTVSFTILFLIVCLVTGFLLALGAKAYSAASTSFLWPSRLLSPAWSGAGC